MLQRPAVVSVATYEHNDPQWASAASTADATHECVLQTESYMSLLRCVYYKAQDGYCQPNALAIRKGPVAPFCVDCITLQSVQPSSALPWQQHMPVQQLRRP